MGQLIGNLLTTDPDNVVKKVQTFTYELISNQDGRFQILENQLQVHSFYCLYIFLKFFV